MKEKHLMPMLYTIQQRERHSSAAFASHRHFTVDEGQSVAPEILLDEPGWTPYSLDDESRLIYFVQCPAETNLAESAFVYSGQFEAAQRLLSISYEALIGLKVAMKRPEKLIFIYSMGRCGSTLMAQILNQIPGAYSLSEPDIFTLLAYLRKDDASRDAELVELLEVCSLMLYPQNNLVSPPKHLALKFRSHALGLSDLLDKAFADAANIFMYRHALSWAKSVYRFLRRLNFPVHQPYAVEDAKSLWKGLTGGDPVYLEAWLNRPDETLYFTDLLAPAWTSYLDKYLQNHEAGVRFFTLRYEELNAEREKSLSALLAYCDLPANALAQSMSAFDKDSQEGTAIARDVKVEEMSQMLIERFYQALAQHSRFKVADERLP